MYIYVYAMHMGMCTQVMHSLNHYVGAQMVLDTVQEEIDAVVSKFGHFDEAVSVSWCANGHIHTVSLHLGMYTVLVYCLQDIYLQFSEHMLYLFC